jgi:threonyl-tRNA synthetase
MATGSEVRPLELFEAQGKLSPNVVAVRGDGRVVDLHTPVPVGAPVEPSLLTGPAALPGIRYSSAHALADAMQRLFPAARAKIRAARNLRVPYLAVVRQEEAEAGRVSAHSRDQHAEPGLLTLDGFIARVHAEAPPPSLRSGQSMEEVGSTNPTT